jgi:hypothetical protein
MNDGAESEPLSSEEAQALVLYRAWKRARQALRGEDGLSEEFEAAITLWRWFGRVDFITDALRAEGALTKGDREWLAQFIERRIRLPRGKPLLAHGFDDVSFAVEMAAADVERQIREETAAGKKRRGLNAKAMEAAAAKFAPYAKIDPADFQEKLATFIARGGRR